MEPLVIITNQYAIFLRKSLQTCPKNSNKVVKKTAMKTFGSICAHLQRTKAILFPWYPLIKQVHPWFPYRYFSKCDENTSLHHTGNVNLKL